MPATPPETRADDPLDVIEFFTDIAIIEQLVRTLRERRLPPGLSMAGYGLMNHMVRTGQETASPAAWPGRSRSPAGRSPASSTSCPPRAS